MSDSNSSQACYRKPRKYKCQLPNDYEIATDIKDHDIDTGFLKLTSSGMLTIRAGYAWDGPSGPTVDTKTFMRGSLVHDALYQMIRENHISLDYRGYADDLLKEICLEDKMSKIRAWYVHGSLRLFGGPAAQSDKDKYKKITCVPET